MYAIEEDTKSQETVTLHVSDPARSHEFYQDLFGLIMRETTTPGAQRLLETPGDQRGVSLLLRRAGESEGPLWLSVEVASVGEVLDLYLLAIMMGAKALLPRKRGQRWNTVVTDPDGNRISVWTKVNDEAEQPETALRPQRWEWRLSAARGEGEMMDDLAEKAMPRASMLDGASDLPGRSAAGADRVDRRQSASGGARTPPAPGRNRLLEGKE